MPVAHPFLYLGRFCHLENLSLATFVHAFTMGDRRGRRIVLTTKGHKEPDCVTWIARHVFLRMTLDPVPDLGDQQAEDNRTRDFDQAPDRRRASM
jgi:hypothetical protein